MATFQGVFFLVLGIGLVLVARRSLASGRLPCGPNFLKGRLEFDRTDQPLGYWLMFGAYGLGGALLVVFAVRLLLGVAEPLPLS